MTSPSQPATSPSVDAEILAFRENLREAWSALAMIRETIETLGPIGALPASEHLPGPTFMHEAEALVAGIRALSAPRVEPVAELYAYIPDIVKNAMLTMWNYICDDSKHHPLDIEHGKGKFLTFEPRHWAQFTGDMVQRNIRDLFAAPPSQPDAGSRKPALDPATVESLDALKAAFPFLDNSESPGGCNGKHPDCDHCAAIAKVKKAIRALSAKEGS